jgi:FtsZ-binding cell division protein ZapB
MTHMKLQAALDELERLCETVKGFKERNGALPNPDSDAGRAMSALETFTTELHKLNIAKILEHKI